MANFICISALVVLVCLAVSIDGHGRMMRPAGRSSLWRFPEYANQGAVANYDDHQLYCGGELQHNHPGTNCGVCGDPLWESRPRPNERGGRYARGIISGWYNAGQVIDVEVELTQSHNGYMEWRLCTNPNDESQACFNQHLLQRSDGTGSWLVADRGTGWYRSQYRLPNGVRCNPCVLQWNYRAAQHWPSDGPQENFRGCADIVIN